MLGVDAGAVVRRGQLTGVYVVGSDKVARFRLVTTGEIREKSVEILSGLTSGEQVVVAGVERVTDGALIETQTRTP
jgi:multidrug efflux pump subunit AcrA (membrane-fusion protein)